ncbi:hypothetical protein J4448_01985 [Candidatus Woesearchaeota archaeon]|nr:hypothetical protein [Candidatus Woesearchaeota archaeon]
MQIEDLFGNRLHLPDARLRHIKEKHPEIGIQDIKSVLSKPDFIIKSSLYEDIKIYHRKKGKYYIVSVINLSKKLIITSFTSDKIKKGELEWTRS